MEHEPDCDLLWKAPELHPRCSCKPLHVRIAEVLGCTPIPKVIGTHQWWECRCPKFPHGENRYDLGPGPSLFHYDSDWSATGPLIEKFEIALYYGENEWLAYPSADIQSGTGGDFKDHLWLDGSTFDAHNGPTPLTAVCHLLLALAEAGKLKVQ